MEHEVASSSGAQSPLDRTSPDDEQSVGTEDIESPHLRISQGQRSADIQREDSGASSELTGEFMQRDPEFSTKASITSSDSELTDLAPAAVLVTVLWRQLSVVLPARIQGACFHKQATLLQGVTGFAEPREVLAIVGPVNSGKSALLAAIAGHLTRPAKAFGEVLINGLPVHKSKIEPTFFSTWDEPLTYLTIEQVLLYTALLKWQSAPKPHIEGMVRKTCKALGLLPELQRTTDNLPRGLQRRVAVACQYVGSSPLLIMNNAVEGVPEGDALTILRAVNERAREGATVIVECGGPTTDIASFFTRALVLAGGEVVYFGGTGMMASKLLADAGVPCPPLYSPLEHFMRLIDPSFEVYLQVSQVGSAPEWNSRFSGMMFKVLQASYEGSSMAKHNKLRLEHLVSMSPDTSSWSPTPLTAWRQGFVLIRRLVAQGLRCFSLYLARIVLGVLIAIIYAASYSDLSTDFVAAYSRLTVLYIVAGFLPMLALTSLFVYHNSVLVYKRERESCNVGYLTHVLALFTIVLPHVLVSAVLTAVIFIPWTPLNSTGEAWGYFICNTFLVMMCADALVMACVSVFTTPYVQFTVALALLIIQLLASDIFPGTNLGIQLPLSAVTFTGWSYRGLMLNEFTDGGPWGCPSVSQIDFPRSPGQTFIVGRDPLPSSCQMPGSVMRTILIRVHGNHDWGASKWKSVYILIGIYMFWSLVALIALVVRCSLVRGKGIAPVSRVPVPKGPRSYNDSENPMRGIPTENGQAQEDV